MHLKMQNMKEKLISRAELHQQKHIAFKNKINESYFDLSSIDDVKKMALEIINSANK